MSKLRSARKYIREIRANALWDFFKFLWRNASNIYVISTIILSWWIGWIRQLPILLLIPFVLGCAILAGAIVNFIIERPPPVPEEDTPQESHTVAGKYDPHPKVLALDDLKKLLQEGDMMTARYHVSTIPKPSASEVDDYRIRTLSCVRQKALEVPLHDLHKFEQELDQERLSLVQAKYVDAGLLEPSGQELQTFGKLYNRVERVRELILELQVPPEFVKTPDQLKLPKKVAITQYERLDEIAKEGDLIMKRFRGEQPTIPNKEEYQNWNSRLMDVAGNCALVDEYKRLRDCNPLEVELGSTMGVYLHVSKEFWDIGEELVIKLAIIKKIMARLRKDH